MRTYDFVMTHKLDADDFFIHRVQQHCAERGFNFFLIEPTWAEEFLRKLEDRKIRARVLLNMHSEHHQPEDIFHRLVLTAHRLGVHVIDPPDLAAAAFNKALLHPRLLEAGFKLPETVIVVSERVGDFRLSDEDRARIGAPFVIKPGNGYGKKGVILNATGEDHLQRSAQQWPDAHYLIQRRIVPKSIADELAYFRTFYVFGHLWFCWWNCFNDRYRVLTPDEMGRFQLGPLREIVCRLAALTKMNFFSSEIAQADNGEFVLIDYVNDQCHMLSQSSDPRLGVPDDVVAGIARRLVEAAGQKFL